MTSEVAETLDASVVRPRQKLRQKFSLGFAVSVGLHLAALAIFILALGYAAAPSETVAIIPVSIVRLANEPASPSQAHQSNITQEETALAASPEAKPVALAPQKPRPAPDDLEIKLQNLADLRQPLMDQNLVGKSEDISRQSTRRPDVAAGSEAAIKDFLRDQIEHHWNPDLGALRGRSISVLLRVALTRAGVVTRVDLVNAREAGIDPGYDEAAMSARDAALLSSPLTLPPGQYPATMDFILSVDTRDALR